MGGGGGVEGGIERCCHILAKLPSPSPSPHHPLCDYSPIPPNCNCLSVMRHTIVSISSAKPPWLFLLRKQLSATFYSLVLFLSSRPVFLYRFPVHLRFGFIFVTLCVSHIKASVFMESKWGQPKTLAWCGIMQWISKCLIALFATMI